MLLGGPDVTLAKNSCKDGEGGDDEGDPYEDDDQLVMIAELPPFLSHDCDSNLWTRAVPEGKMKIAWTRVVIWGRKSLDGWKFPQTTIFPFSMNSGDVRKNDDCGGRKAGSGFQAKGGWR